MAVRFVLIVACTLWGGVPTSAGGQNDGRDQLLHYSLQVDINDEARAQFASAEAELARGDVLTAVSRWRALLDSTRPGHLIPVGGAFVSIPRAVSAALRAQPDKVQREYLNITEPIAGRALAEAVRNDDLAGLWRVVDRYPFTEAALGACEQIAGRCFDAGRLVECRLAVDRWFDEGTDARQLVRRRPEMVAWRRLSLLQSGDARAADDRWREFADEIPAGLLQLVARLEVEWLPDQDGPVISDLAQVLPSDEVVWTLSLADEAREKSLLSPVSDFEELAQPLLMVARPIVTVRGVLVTGATHRVLDVDLGSLKWHGQVAAVTSGSIQQDAVHWLRASLGESIAARGTVVGDDVFTVQPLNSQRPRVGYDDQLVRNSLLDGGLVRSLQEFPVSPKSELESAKVLGPPGSGHGQVYVAIEADQTLSVVAYGSDSLETRWQTTLGDAGLSLTADERRLWMPAVFEAGGDSVICATGNGGVASLDPRTGRTNWIHRSEREDWRGAGPPPMAPTTNLPRFRMWAGWREPVLHTFDDVVVWVGPEANEIVGLDRRTGQARWSRPRGTDLAVVAEGETLLVIGCEEVRRLNEVDGEVTWSTSIAAPSGVGFVAGEWYIQPLRSGGHVALRVDDGAATRSVSWGTEVAGQERSPLDELRSVTWTPRGIVMQTPREVSLHRTLAAIRESSPSAAKTEAWLLAAGRGPEVTGRDAGLSDLLKRISQETDAGQFHLAEPPAEHKVPPDSREPGEAGSVERFLANRSAETAIKLFENVSLKSLALVWVESNRRPHVRVRADVLAAATILSGSPASGSAQVSLAPALRAQLDQMLRRVAASRPDDVPRLLELFKRSEWGASRILDQLQDAPATAAETREHARRRLMLLSLMAAGGDVAARAKAHEEPLRPAERTVAAWPESEPRLASVRPRKSVLDRSPVQFDRTAAGEMECLTIDVSLTGLRVRNTGMGVHFSGCGQSRPWEIDLPKTPRSLGQSTDYRQAWGIGPLVILQTGTGLHGLVPFDSAGDRQASRLWDVSWIDMWGSISTHHVAFLPRHSDMAPGRHPLDLDHFGRPLSQVGPVTPSYFCYREFGRLVSCETATGRRLWDRADFEPDAIAVGGEAAVIVVTPSRNRVEILDPMTGALVSARELDGAAGVWRTAIDTTAVFRRGAMARGTVSETPSTQPSELSAQDLTTGETMWKQPVEAGAIDFTVGRRLVGAVESKAIRLFDATSGTEKGSVPIESLPELAEVYAVDDPFALMIAVFGSPAVEQLQPPLMFLGNRRKPYANGVVYGLDPETLAPKWTLKLDQSVFPLDQPRDIPLLAIHDAVAEGGNGNPLRIDRIRVFDKRTGRMVGRELREEVGTSGMIIERSQRDGWIELRTSKGVIRYEFGAGE